ncbi:MAG: TolC family protein [Flavobacteriales bacterium]|nr:TolC family protein [Flavobacteriales bacterium]
MRAIPVIASIALSIPATAQQAWTLEQCVKRAEERSLSVLNAQLDAELADKTRDQGYWSLAPDLNGGATHGYNYGRVIDRFTNTFANDRVRTNNFFLSSTLSLFEGFRKQSVIRRNEVDAKAARLGIDAARNQARLESAQAFLDVVALRERKAASEAQAASTREQIARTQALVEAGRLARADLLAIESQLAQEEFAVVDLGNQADQRMLALGRALQLEPQEMLSFSIQAPAITGLRITEPTADPAEVLANVLRSNPSFAQAEAQAQSAEKGIGIARSGSMPTLGLNGSVGTGYSGRNFQQVGEPIIGDPVVIGSTLGGDLVYAPTFNVNTELTPFGKQLDQNLNQSLLFQLNVPIFNQMQNRLSIDRARVQHERARNSLVAVRNDLQRNVLDAIVAQRSAYKQFLAAQKAVDAAALNEAYATERLAQGAITSMELATIKATVNRSQADLIAAKYQYLMAQKYLEILQGMPVAL